MSTQEELNEQLIDAASWGETEKVQALLAAGADVNAANKEGMTALMLAAVNNRTETVKALIEAGADVNAKREDGMTALLFAAQDGEAETARALLAAGAGANAQAFYGYTALMYAAKRGSVEMVRALLAAGAKPNALQYPFSKIGWGALLVVAATVLCAVFAILKAMKTGGWIIELVWVPIAVHWTVTFVLDNVNPRDETALMIAARRRNEEVIRALIAGGANAVYDAAVLRLRGRRDAADAIAAARKRAGKPEVGRD